MSFDRNGKFYYFKLTLNRLSNGLILYSIRDLLMRIGLNIGPYYWVQEGFANIVQPQIMGNPKEYELSYFNRNDILEIGRTKTDYNANLLLKEFEKGRKCIGLKHNAKIASFMFVQFDDVYYHKRVFKLKENEAYLNLMYTYNEFRGRNLAPYLRYLCYNLLKSDGVDNLYSISTYFNTSAISFKKKLNSKNIALYLYIGIYRYTWNFVLKKY